jgi:hypothetical protein
LGEDEISLVFEHNHKYLLAKQRLILVEFGLRKEQVQKGFIKWLMMP